MDRTNINYEGPLISIIVAVYNTEPYLNQCLQSIADQTLSKSDYEVIIVDDCSTDHSRDIAKEFCEKYSNFRLIELPENTPGGCATPCNIGMNEAKGLYIGFVDSDDYARPYMFERMLSKAFEDNIPDLCLCEFEEYREKRQTVVPVIYQHGLWDRCKRLKNTVSFRYLQTLALQWFPGPFGKIYRRDFLNENQLRFPEGDFAFEDGPFHWYVITKAKNISFVLEPLYYYRMGRTGQSYDGTRKEAKKLLICMKIHAKLIKDFLLKNNLYEEFLTEYLVTELQKAEYIFGQHRGAIDRNEVYEEVASDLHELFKDIPFKVLKNARKWQTRLIKYWIIIRTGKYALAKAIQDKYKIKYHKFRTL